MKANFFKIEDKKYLTAWILVTACFALWGFANNVTTPMVNAFSKIFRISTAEASLVPVVFNLGYFCLAFPAAMFIQRYSYKAGILLGLALFAAGSLFFIPARWIGAFLPFLSSYFVLTCGLSFLETACNPYIYSLGSKSTAIGRLNAAQAFNALGSVIGMLLAISVHSHLTPVEAHVRHKMPQQAFDIIKDHDLGVLIQPYILIGAIVIIILVLLAVHSLPKNTDIKTTKGTLDIMRDLLHNKPYREGVIAEFFYVGAQVCCWTFIIQYGTRIFVAEGMNEQASEVLSQKYNTIALVFFALGRFICAWLMRYFSPSRMLSIMGIVGVMAVLGVVLFNDRNGLICLVVVSACMSLMFPTIYGIALINVGENIKIAGAGLVMAILGGSFFPPIQAAILQIRASFLGLSSTNVSFLVPLICLCVVVWYGHRSYVRYHIIDDDGNIPNTPAVIE